ncbi:MAG: EAL domain-containing protein [Clostridia bacterium]|nr:EAL domain-containing protein [Clostridia bacterium]
MDLTQNDKRYHAKFDRLAELFDNSNTGIWEMNDSGEMVFYNSNFYNNFDIPEKYLNLDDWIAIIHPEDQAYFNQNISSHNKSRQESFKSEYRVFDKNEKIHWIAAHGIAQFDDHGKMISMIGSHTDITLDREYKSHLYTMAYIDERSNLYNRKKLLEILKEHVENHIDFTFIVISALKYDQHIAVYGPQFVDALSTIASKTLKATLDDDTTLFRVSNDDFAIISTTITSNESAINVVKRVRSTMNDLLESYNLNGFLKMTAGVLQYPTTLPNCSAEDVFKSAYITLNEAKNLGEGTISFYSEENKQIALKKLFIESHILKDLRNNRFYIDFQPIVNASTGECICFESLVRWRSEEWGIIPPDEFIAIAEGTREIIQIGDFVLDQACQFIKEYNRCHHSKTKVAINISVIQILQSDFIKKMTHFLEYYQLEGSLITLEITETIMINHSTFVASQLNALKALGINIALDDFGSGYASFNTFLSIPLNEVKIDRQIMLKSINNPLVANFIQSIVQLFHHHNLQVVGEGIEDLDMVDYAKLSGIDMLQGYHFSRPMDRETALNFSPCCIATK